MKEDILVRLADLLKQATTERSHYYVGGCVTDAIAEIGALRMQVAVQMQEIARLRVVSKEKM